jgi:hypothetical protein
MRGNICFQTIIFIFNPGPLSVSKISTSGSALAALTADSLLLQHQPSDNV